MKCIAEFKAVDNEPQEGDFVLFYLGENRIGILGKTGVEGFSEIYDLNGRFIDTTDMFRKVIPIYKKPNWFQKLFL